LQWRALPLISRHVSAPATCRARRKISELLASRRYKTQTLPAVPGSLHRTLSGVLLAVGGRAQRVQRTKPSTETWPWMCLSFARASIRGATTSRKTTTTGQTGAVKDAARSPRPGRLQGHPTFPPVVSVPVSSRVPPQLDHGVVFPREPPRGRRVPSRPVGS
jgi:hypothetical protein